MISENDENNRRKKARVFFEEIKDSIVVTWASIMTNCYRDGKGNERILRYKRYPMEIDRGYILSQFVTNPEKLICEFENARVLIID